MALLKIYDDAYSGYYAYKYDSAMAYVNRGLLLARKINNHDFFIKNTLHRAQLLASIGFYVDAENCLKIFNENTIPSHLLYDYFFTQYKLYSFWNSYYSESEFKDRLIPEILFYLEKALRYAPKHSILYNYLYGEYYKYQGKTATAARYFKYVVDEAPQNMDLYGSAAYNLANCHLEKHELQDYEHYLILAAIGDIKCVTKENVALQDLAMYIFNNKKNNIDLAEKYITASMKDAQFYNSRLRMIGMSRKLPMIVSAYQDRLSSRNRYLLIGISIITLLLLSLLALLVFSIRQNRLLRYHRAKIAANYGVLEELNAKVNMQNHQLLEINTRREALAKVYIDLCAKYIDKLKKFQMTVVRKIKANQVRDLLSSTSSSRLSDEDTETFLSQFDKAFLSLYPSFVHEVNKLLKVDSQILVKNEHALPMEIRVLALIRLGVKDSSEIAGLLFYSPQTVYNYRWALKTKARNKDSFEDDVMQLCKYD